ncbi:YceK/YidQ family lipoprotein [Leptospira noguchii]|uniref:YceK/YidQ family lipoprotein n=1 Tax=Leptospira noguchii TaxID=28182 RepID=UPI001FB69F26|nr:YceK/YidQ family lipoprotein [Leptospira noguchii]UOG34111.1 YceK/YidQ family lipoprotein [Leptospira noguchii]UOG44974.1 YceK/YidQ family lipoprotein [Leptospira noguchii]
MVRKIIILFLIFLHFDCSTSLTFIEAVKKKKDYRPYDGTLIDIFLISLGPFGVFYGKSTTLSFISGLIDLPLSFVLDTILLPGTIPYYIYVKSGRPGSENWYNQKFSVRLKSFRDQNPPYAALKLIIAENDLEALQEFFKSYDVIALEKKIRYLQEENLLPYEHREQSPYYPETGIIDYMGAFFSKGEPYNYQRESNPLSLGDRLEFAYLLYEEFRKDPILEKRYYDTVWKVCFSSGVLIENPNILKKVILEFSEKKEISDLFASIAQEYSEKRYKHFQDFFHDSYYFLNKAKTQKSSEFWYNRMELLTKLDKFLQKNPELQKKWKLTAWISAISSGVIAYRPPLLERAFREFPIETEKSALNLFVAAYKSKNRQSVDIIAQNLKDAKTFPLDQLYETNIENILEYPYLLEKLLQTGWDPNLILEWKKPKFNGRKKSIQTEEKTLLILAMEDDLIPVETIRILLKYGANPGLGVKRNSDGKEYMFYPLAAINSNGNNIIKESKQKILMDWKK